VGWRAHCSKPTFPIERVDHAFVPIADPQKAQAFADGLSAQSLHVHFDQWVQRFCPVVHRFRSGYHGSFMQVEYAGDGVFCHPAQLKPLYEAIVRTAVHVIKAEQVATFLGRKLTGAYPGELGHHFSTRIQGTGIRHSRGPARIKLYDKAGLITRVECTTHDVSFFKHHRYVEQRNGERVFKLAPLRKSLYSLNDLRPLMQVAHERSYAFMAGLDSPDAEHQAITKMAAPAHIKGRSFRGFNLFLDPDYQLFLALARGEWAISGVRAADLREHIKGLSPGRCCYILKRLLLLCYLHSNPLILLRFPTLGASKKSK